MDALLGIFSAFGLSASAGLNAYIPLLVVGVIAHYTNLIKLNPPYDVLANPYILILIGILLIIEMLADKVPVANHINDLIQTFVRPVAGAIVFAASTKVVNINPIIALGIASTKMVIVILFFMHVKYQSNLIKMTVGAGFFTFLVLITMTLSDYMSRAWGLW